MVGHETSCQKNDFIHVASSCHANLENGKFHWDAVIVLLFSTLQLAVKNYFPTRNRLLRDSAPPLFPIITNKNYLNACPVLTGSHQVLKWATDTPFTAA
jgi:hypothetical protein